jgi:hypothetical protein
MTETDKFIGTIIISNESHIDLFKVHVYEKSIRFDPKFANGIAINDSVSKEIYDIDNKWKSGKICRDDIFPMMVNIVGKYETFLSKYYFEMSELDMKGRYVGEQHNLDDIINVEFEDRMRMYYAYLKGSGKMEPISRKEFEKYILRTEASESYLNAFEPKGASYYRYDTVDIKRKPKTCYVMAKSGAVKFAFCL